MNNETYTTGGLVTLVLKLSKHRTNDKCHSFTYSLAHRSKRHTFAERVDTSVSHVLSLTRSPFYSHTAQTHSDGDARRASSKRITDEPMRPVGPSAVGSVPGGPLAGWLLECLSTHTI